MDTDFVADFVVGFVALAGASSTSLVTAALPTGVDFRAFGVGAIGDAAFSPTTFDVSTSSTTAAFAVFFTASFADTDEVAEAFAVVTFGVAPGAAFATAAFGGVGAALPAGFAGAFVGADVPAAVEVFFTGTAFTDAALVDARVDALGVSWADAAGAALLGAFGVARCGALTAAVEMAGLAVVFVDDFAVDVAVDLALCFVAGFVAAGGPAFTGFFDAVTVLDGPRDGIAAGLVVEVVVFVVVLAIFCDEPDGAGFGWADALAVVRAFFAAAGASFAAGRADADGGVDVLDAEASFAPVCFAPALAFGAAVDFDVVATVYSLILRLEHPCCPLRTAQITANTGKRRANSARNTRKRQTTLGSPAVGGQWVPRLDRMQMNSRCQPTSGLYSGADASVLGNRAVLLQVNGNDLATPGLAELVKPGEMIGQCRPQTITCCCGKRLHLIEFTPAGRDFAIKDAALGAERGDQSVMFFLGGSSMGLARLNCLGVGRFFGGCRGGLRGGRDPTGLEVGIGQNPLSNGL